MAAAPVLITDISCSNINTSGRSKLHIGDNINISNTYQLHCERSIAIGPTQRIGLTACVTGLQRLTDALLTRILPELSASSHSFNAPLALIRGLQDARIILVQLEAHFRDVTKLSYERASLVQADHLVVSFTNAVVLMSEIQHECSHINGADRFSYLRAHGYYALVDLSARLTAQCGIWRSQLDVLESSSNEQAYNTSYTLGDLLNRLLADNQDLRRRMASFDHDLAKLVEDRGFMLDPPHADSEESHECENMNRVSLNSHDFEELLQQTWVYRRNEDREEIMSFRSSVARDYAWSEISQLSLAHLSIISVIALPVQTAELADSSWYRGVAEQAEQNDRPNLQVESLQSESSQVETFKSFRVGIHDPCEVVLPIALRRYHIHDDWRQYDLCIIHGDQERIVGLKEKPLYLLKALQREGLEPKFMLRRNSGPPHRQAASRTLDIGSNSASRAVRKDTISVTALPVGMSEPENNSWNTTAPEVRDPNKRDDPGVDIFKTFRVAIDESCEVLLPMALLKYDILDDWRQYAIWMTLDDEERQLGLDEKPLLLVRELESQGRKPTFMLRLASQLLPSTAERAAGHGNPHTAPPSVTQTLEGLLEGGWL